MRIEGTYIISAPRQTVWQHLMNPDSLARSMPGCEKLVPNSDGSYHAELKIGISAVKGNYHGRVEILDSVAPERYRMRVEGQGMGGFVKGEGMLTLAEDGAAGTKIVYAGDAQVGGVIANVGQRLILAAARQMVNHFFRQFSQQVQSSLLVSPIVQPVLSEGASTPVALMPSAQPAAEQAVLAPAPPLQIVETTLQEGSPAPAVPPRDAQPTLVEGPSASAAPPQNGQSTFDQSAPAPDVAPSESR